jgi:hypothetical protein
MGSGVFVNTIGTATVTVTGVGPATFTDAVQVAANHNFPSAGFGDISSNLAILFTDNNVFTGYDLTTSIGPTSGSPSFNPGAAFGTDHGSLIFTSFAGQTTFSATTAVPEPASLTLLGIGAAGLLGYGWRRRRPRA